MNKIMKLLNLVAFFSGKDFFKGQFCSQVGKPPTQRMKMKGKKEKKKKKKRKMVGKIEQHFPPRWG